MLISLILFLAEAHFTEDFSVIIQIMWKINSAVILILTKWSLQKFAHDTTTVLSCHVQTFVAIRWSVMELQQNRYSIKFELRWKIHKWNVPLVDI